MRAFTLSFFRLVVFALPGICYLETLEVRGAENKYRALDKNKLSPKSAREQAAPKTGKKPRPARTTTKRSRLVISPQRRRGRFACMRNALHLHRIRQPVVLPSQLIGARHPARKQKKATRRVSGRKQNIKPNDTHARPEYNSTINSEFVGTCVFSTRAVVGSYHRSINRCVGKNVEHVEL